MTGAGTSAGPRISSASSQEPGWGEVTPSAVPDKPCALGGFASQMFLLPVSHLPWRWRCVWGPLRTRIQRPGPEILAELPPGLSRATNTSSAEGARAVAGRPQASVPGLGLAQPRASVLPAFHWLKPSHMASGRRGGGWETESTRASSSSAHAFSFWLPWVFAVACGLLWLRCAGWLPCGTWGLGSLTRDQT